MRTEELLDEVEPLSHRERCHHLSVRVRELSGRPELAALLGELAEGGSYERLLAVRMAAMAKDLRHLTRALTDPDPDISAPAMAQAVKLGAPADDILTFVRTAPAHHRMTAYRAIRRHRRTDLAERLIGEVGERWGDREAASLLAACGADAAAARLPDLTHAVPSWAALAKHHPILVLDHAERVLDGLPGSLRDAWWQAVAPGVEVAAWHAPERVIALLERHWTPRSWRCAGRLLDADPARTLALYLAPGRQPQLAGLLAQASVRRRLAVLTDERLGELGRAVRERDAAVIDLLRALPPSRRDGVFTATMRGVDLSQWVHFGELMSVLPLRRRVAEARRMLGLRAIAEDDLRTLEITAFLPYDEAEPVLRAATRRSDPLDRANGYVNLIACAGRSRDPEALTRLTDALTRLRNEQDPVHGAAVSALAVIPGRLFQPAHVPFLDRLAEDALAARDCSVRTRHAVSGLAARVFEQGATREDAALLEFGMRTFERVIEHVGTATLSHLPEVLRRGQEVELVRRLAPYLEAAAGHDRHRLAFLLATALGRRGHELPELRRALERALDAVEGTAAIEAVEHWLRPPRTRGERVAGLLAADPSAVNLGQVFEVLAWWRTDLLEVALGPRDPQGRFGGSGARRTHDVPRRAVLRWTARQREAYLGLLERIARDTTLPVWERARAVRKIGEVPGADAGRLRPFVTPGKAAARQPHTTAEDAAPAQAHATAEDAAMTRGEAVIRRAALTALPWTAAPQDVLGDLLAHAGGNDAHVAVYGAARAARFVRPAELAAALEPVLAGGKVTARKEAVRLLARHRAPGVMGVLRRLWDEEGGHRDVRAAIVSAMPELLADPAAWELLREAVAAVEDVAAAVLAPHPLSLPERWRPAYGELVAAATRSAELRTRLAAVQALPRWDSYVPGAAARLGEIVRELGETAEWRSAAHGLVGVACSESGVAELRRTVRALAAAPDGPDAGAERDRPATQRLAALVLSLRLSLQADARRRGRRGTRHVMDPESARRPARAVVDELPEDLAAELLAAVVDWEHDPGDDLARLLGTIPGVLAAVEAGKSLAGSARHVPAERLLPHARWLAEQGEGGALLAVALAETAAIGAGWDEPWRELLRGVRASGWPEAEYRARQVRTAME
ncbi:hypothetical protein FXF51_37705 [Nonomuraea sp. PA05]|uniref:hypothetical protein n=1 Tax=Nonomuraea sp. PA05 TaxID=2604466 RepID=UPI0011D62E26|nr:hypothetical protein [Nonomuraea sp. PA05]TYB58387.1 hypothetical protein FXF51_37705 [Nonomuraea sp. PA05]